MYFPIANIEINPLIPPLTAFVISFFTSMGGLSGAFLILPFQVSILGFTSPAVSATNQLFNIVAIPSGLYHYIKEGRMVWPLTWVVIIGTLPGVLIGAILRIHYLPNPQHFKLFAGLVLLSVGYRLLINLLNYGKSFSNQVAAEENFRQIVKEHYQSSIATKTSLPRIVIKRFTLTHIIYEFYGQEFDIHVLGIITLSLLVGIVGGAYGIGGSAIIAPLLVGFFGLPVYTVAGATLLGNFITSIAGVLFYQTIAPFYPTMSVAPDWFLGLLFGIGGFGGMYYGAKLQKFVSAKIIKWILVACILATAFDYIITFFLGNA
jgi:uncharacterized membrane protein YfcA